jgi:predicted helicase
MTITIHDLLKKLKENAISTRDQGDKFERLIVNYLQIDPLYQEKFSQVWLWMDYPHRNNQIDTGIDIVAQERITGNYCAIQCKFYHPDYTLDKKDIDSFFTASGKADFTSRMIISTTDKWTKHAEDALKNQQIPVIRLRLQDLENSPIDWSDFSQGQLKLLPKKILFPHQKNALNNVIAGFNQVDRGKLIMACGTGKTFTSLKIAEQFADPHGYILFLVPSLSLLSQSLREWTAQSDLSLHCVAVCSDVNVGKTKNKTSEDLHSYDLPLIPTTDPQILAEHLRIFGGQKQLTVIFSTYQSIETIQKAQKIGLPQFDLIICDEAHRTTGVTLVGAEDSTFVKVHDQNIIKGKKRLYMTATPRLYGEIAKIKAQENDAILCSMDDQSLYGPELHRLGFAEAVENGLLTDYKVMVLAVDEKYISRAFQDQLADENNQLNLEDAVKIVGCWNGLSKQIDNSDDSFSLQDDNHPMSRAVAFCASIKESKQITELFPQIIAKYREKHPDEDVLDCQIHHVDGTQNSAIRHEELEWLKADISDQGKICRILSNARCLSEGVDVPALDAVMFLTPRNSQVDVVQSVGRVMRKSAGKKYGYIILPIGIPADLTPEEALKDNEKYKVIWQVLQALRAHDDRFNIIINQLELNKNTPEAIEVIGVSGDSAENPAKSMQMSLNFPYLDQWKEALFAKIVIKCGDRRYWEDWAKDVAKIADSHIARIKGLLVGANGRSPLQGPSPAKQAFDEFLQGLHQNINPNVTEDEAIEMLAQHLITKPVFDALFEGYEFTKFNPVSKTMQGILDVLEGQSLEKEVRTLEKFYQSVKQRAAGIDNAEGKQRIIIELYDKFFRAAFPRLVERLGIVYTPVEVVDFIIRSADYALKQEFGCSLTDEGVHILDPFTGTGTFMVRLLQSGLIKPEDLQRKFTSELHANEIVLLAYYIAAINVEETYHYLSGNDYQPFNGIILTDTFQMFENDGYLMEKIFPENNQRVINQKGQEITVIIGNPPYSAKQKSENDSNKNLSYEKLDSKIENSYAKHSTATNKQSIYDSYIRAFRWASDRIEDKGIVCFVINGSFIDTNNLNGLRKCLIDEFTNIYCFNLRGNQRTSGEQSKKEGGKIFGSGSRNTIAIIILIKNPYKTPSKQVNYYDIGDYLSREQKLSIIREFADISAIQWEQITPNDSYDWINQRNDTFESFMPLGDKKGNENKTIFDVYSQGILTSRDAWIYNFSQQSVIDNMTRMISFYNEQVKQYKKVKENKSDVEIFIDTDPKKISWSSSLKDYLKRKLEFEFNQESLFISVYRPYCKQWFYFDNYLNHRVGQIPKIFPSHLDNLGIYVTGIGETIKDFSALIVNVIPNLQLHSVGQCFPLYTYEKQEDLGTLFTTATGEYVKKENIPDTILTDFQKIYQDKTITKEDIFYYVYGVLHSPEYKQRFASDLKKMLPRIPYCGDFHALSKAGRELAYWHLNYETIEPYELKEENEELYLDAEDYRVEKMVFAKNKKEVDKTTIIYNSKIKLSKIPLETYEYIVNGKSALEWVMERYKITQDKDSGITNDPNDWSEDPRYIIDLVKRIVRVSVETVEIIKKLPPFSIL